MDVRLNNLLNRLRYSLNNRNMLEQIRNTENRVTLTKEQLSDLQMKKLRELLFYAYNNCPFYHEKYSNLDLRPEDISNFDDFQKVPIITNTELRENIEKMIPTCIDRSLLEVAYTGGSTGVPLKVYWDRRKKDLMQALYLRTIRFWGCDIGTKTAWIWGRIPSEPERLMDFRYQSKFRRFLRNVTWFNAYDMTEETMREFAEFLNQFKPGLIIGYVNALCEYARFLKENMIKIYSPKAIWITAEPSGFHQRKLIEKAFGAKTYNQYGSSEILHIAAECSIRSGLHIHADSRYVEICDANNMRIPPGEIGNIIVTDLENRVMPLIRYKNEDMGSLKQSNCKCGINLPLMDNVVGRSFDIIKLKNGRKVYGIMFSKIMFGYVEEIKQFQFHQVSLENIIVRIVPAKTENLEKLRHEIHSRLRKHTANLIDYSFEFVDSIRKEKSGKLQYVKSDL